MKVLPREHGYSLTDLYEVVDEIEQYKELIGYEAGDEVESCGNQIYRDSEIKKQKTVLKAEVIEIPDDELDLYEKTKKFEKDADGKWHWVDIPEDELREREEQERTFQESLKISELRRRRQKECFDVCDGAARYDSWTAEQKAEVQAWRKAWLDVTDTLVVPDKPEFLK